MKKKTTYVTFTNWERPLPSHFSSSVIDQLIQVQSNFKKENKRFNEFKFNCFVALAFTSIFVQPRCRCPKVNSPFLNWLLYHYNSIMMKKLTYIHILSHVSRAVILFEIGVQRKESQNSNQHTLYC